MGSESSFGPGHTFSVITKAHFGLAQADCVLALANSIKFLKLSLINALRDDWLEWCLV